MRIGTSNLLVLLTIAFLYLLADPLQKRFNFSPVTRNLAVETYILILFGGVGFIFSYLTIENGWAVRDDLIVSIDNFLGFDWRAYTLFVLEHGWLRWASLIMYILAPVLVGFTLFWFCRKGEFSRASELVAMVIVGGVLCVVISGVLPTAGGGGYFPADNEFYRGHYVVFDNSYKDTLFQLRNGAGKDVFLLRPVGLIAFPSYHVCLALVVILLVRGTGVTGWIIIGLSVGSMFSVPVQGGHHLSDVLGGLLVGLIAFWVVKKVSKLPNEPKPNAAQFTDS
jgi:hypothetical protein